MIAAKGPEGTATGRSGPFAHPEPATGEPGSPFVRRIDLRGEDGTVTHVAWTSADAGNLAFHVLGADAGRDEVAESRRRLERAMGVPEGATAYVDQVHSPDVVDADGTGWAEAEPRTADAIVSPAGADPLAIMVADCLPVVLVDERTGATAVAHAGRRGLLDGVLENTVRRLRSLRPSQDADAPGLRAWIGPGICGRCYEVPEHMRDAAAATHPAAVSTTSWGTPALDLPAAAEELLGGLGVAVERVDLCTFEDERLFSHRRAPGRGRIAGLVWRTGAPATSARSVAAEGVVPEGDPRTRELAAALDAVRGRIARAAADAGRADEPVLVVVTKTHPAEDVVRLAGLGVADVGENRDQEARPKAEAVAGTLGPDATRWHFVGQLQTNKAKHVVRYAAAVHSVDRPELVDALSRAVALRREREAPAPVADLDCLVQVDLDDRADADRPEGIGPRGGAAPADVPSLAARIAAADGLALRGLMCVAPRGLDPEACFRRLAALAGELRAEHPEATWLSMGMSGDLEAAVRAGATHVRVGSDVLGARGPRVG